MFQALANHENVPVDVLTKREVEVLRLMAEGLTTKAIASELNVSFKTVACHRYRVLQKLGADSTVRAVRWAIRQGLVA
jgi:two-component system secretion response regulator SsrB